MGEQTWMTENLDVDEFRNGDEIFEAKSTEDWVDAIKTRIPAWSYYDGNSHNGKIYGKLYNWYAVKDPRGLAPEGWKIPSSEDLRILIDGFKNNKEASEKLKYAKYWSYNDRDNRSGNGDNESGFSALPGGYRTGIQYVSDSRFGTRTVVSTGGFSSINDVGRWWTLDTTSSYDCGTVTIYWDNTIHFNWLGDETGGNSVRCIKE